MSFNTHFFAVNKSINKLPHTSYGEWVITKKATCTENGQKTKTCVCGHQIQETIDSTGHKYRDWAVTKLATCTETGVKTQFCRYCDQKKEESIPVKSHVYSDWIVAREATCTATGEKYQACIRCGNEKTETIQSMGHNYKNVEVIRSATCTDTGILVKTCDRCGDKVTESIDKRSHRYGNLIMVEEATCYSTSVQIEICKDCNTSFMYGGSSKLPHTYGDPILTRASTCHTAGINTRTCKVCGDKKEETIPKLEHYYGGDLELSRAPLGQSGLYKIYCSVEGCNGYKEETIPALSTKVTEYVVQDGVDRIGEYAFYGCNKLSKITIPDSVQRIGASAFSGCTNLFYVTIPEGVTTIEQHTFYNCLNLRSVTMPDSVTRIENYAFAECPTLSGAVIPNGVTHIGAYAFENCRGIKELSIPESVAHIGGRAFQKCEGLTKIYFMGDVPEVGQANGATAAFVWLKEKERTAYYPANNSSWESEMEDSSYLKFSWDANLTWESCEHSFEGATCTIGGTCTNCGALGKANGHSFGEATCAEGTSCTVCQAKKAALGHSFLNYQPDGNATCTKDGTKTAKCERCEEEHKTFNVGGALGHDFVDYVTDLEASCTMGGAKTANCSRCEVTDTAVIPALGHSYTEYVADRAVTCENGCTETAACDRCGKETVRVKKATGHDFVGVYTVTSEPVCTTDGMKTLKCSKCEAQDVKIVQASGHNFGAYASNGDATCFLDGTESAKCAACGVTVSHRVNGSAYGSHSFTNYVYNNDATCVNYGTKTAKCDRCQTVSTLADLDQLAPHTEITTSGQSKEPTCTESGWTVSKECSVCKEVLAQQETVPPLGHTEQTIPGKAATCTETGLTEGTKCSVCNVTLTEQQPIPTIEHSWKNEICTVCGAKSDNWQAIVRLAGLSRYETSFAIANEMKKVLDIDKFDTIILANSDNFADALAGSYLAAVKQAPIIIGKLKYAGIVCDYVNQNLNAGGTVYVLGGEGAVPEAMLSGITVTKNIRRLAGDNRYDTNLVILKTAGITGKDVLVATGQDFADSLSASATGLPILLVNGKPGKTLSEGQKALLAAVTGKIYIIGGESAVPESMVQQIEAASGKETERIAGGSRYETSVKIAQEFLSDAESAVVAYASSFPDGLCGGPLAYTIGAPLLLTKDGKSEAPDYTIGNGITSGYVLGGAGLISDGFAKQIFQVTEITK